MGVQTLLGWLGGGGPKGTAVNFGKCTSGCHSPWRGSQGVGVRRRWLFAAGLLTPLAAVALGAVMLIAIATVHRPNGFWVNGAWWGAGVAAAAVVVALLTLTLARSHTLHGGAATHSR